MENFNFYKTHALKMLSLALMAITIPGFASAQITVRDLGQEVSFGRISVFDIDGDGDMDLVVGGESAGATNIKVYTNNGSGTFTETASPLNSLRRPTYDWNDINQDGKPDIILNGLGPFTDIYNTDGTGTFTSSGLMLPQRAPSCGFADLNNDGYLDIFVFGNDDTGKSKILFNSAGTGFTESTQFDGYSFVDPVVSVIDYDNDKDLDLFISAGFEAGLNTRFSKLFVNNGGVFTETTITGLLPKGNGSVTWGDYNADGFADLLLNGDGYINSGEDADNYRLYRNNGNGTFTTIRAFNYRQNFTNGGGRFFDWDNDGDLDIVVTGWDGSRQATDIYINDQGGFSAYVNNAAIPGSSEGAVEIGDADNDGDLDIFITGFSGNDWDGAGTVAPFNRNIAVVALNPTNNTNAAPTVPTNIQVTGSASQLNFSWTASTDATTPQKALTYNMFLVDANGKWFYYPLADTTSGKNKIARMGNVQQNTGWYVKNLPAGTYRWGVQAIDNSYRGSAFAKGSFRISSSGTLPVTIGAYNVVKESDHAVIKWTSLSESNVDRYIVERSLDGKSFETISTTPATGAGNYSFRDRSPSSGNNYYRLTSLDKDGTSQVFEVLSLNFQLAQSGILLYPNPLTTSELNLQLNGYQGKVTVKLIDITGRVLEASAINATATNNYYKVQLKQKPSAGIYKINLNGKNLDETLNLLIN